MSALLATTPSITISNGKLTAKVARIDAAQGFYNGTRFDQAGVVTSLTLNGKEFYGPWFERTAPGVLDYTYVGDDIVAGPDSAISGPVEEFAPLDFEAKPGLFIKIGVGVLYQPDTQAYDHDKNIAHFLKQDQAPQAQRAQITRQLDPEISRANDATRCPPFFVATSAEPWRSASAALTHPEKICAPFL